MKSRMVMVVALMSFAMIVVSATRYFETNCAVAVQDDKELLRTIDNLEKAKERKLHDIALLESKTTLTEKEGKDLKNYREDLKRIDERIAEFRAALSAVDAQAVETPTAELEQPIDLQPQEREMATELTGSITSTGTTEGQPLDMAAAPARAKGRAVAEGADIPMTRFTLKVGAGSKVFNIADVDDEAHVYGKAVNKKNTWLVISKKEFRVYVYEKVNNQTLLRATFPVCYARNAQDKTRTGDSCTPECRDAQTPFTISEIKDASTWRHTFANDPRGNILAYGPYFMRLRLTGSKVPGNNSIGIHGCGGYDGKSNSYSVPGRDSEGCLRLRDNDLRTLRNDYCEVGTKVYIKPATGVAGDKYDYEKAAVKALGEKYVPATVGNPLSGKTKTI